MEGSSAPNHLQALIQTAIAHHQAGQLPQAEQLYRQVLQQQPQHPEALCLLGVIACQRGNLEDGIALYRQALVLRPDYVQARENLYLALWKQGRAMIEEAINGYNQIINFQPKALQAYANLGAILQDQGKEDQAILFYQQGLTIDPHNPHLLNGLGVALQKQHKLKAAVHFHQQALASQPNYIDGLVSLGKVWMELGKLSEAIDCFKHALTLEPNHAIAHHNYALLLLMQGNYHQGFVEYEWRFQTAEFPPCPFKQPVWDGSPLQGRTLLLHAEQGLGDTIQLIRYAAIAQERGGRLVLTCHPPLTRLLSTVPGIEQIVPLGLPLPDFHTYAPLMSLPRILGTTLETIPSHFPYLKAPQSANFPLPVPQATRLKVGIVWSGGNLYKNNHNRSCPLQAFQPLLALPDVTFYSLQKGIPQLDLAELGWQSQIQDLSPHLQDMADTAAAIAQLDLVITVDTAVAHLAGALAKPTWLLLAHLPDWRWLLDREDSPWYPTMRLFRQSHPGDWQGVMQQVVVALQAAIVQGSVSTAKL
ncbi:tetratricopeptide repeat protein [Pantanalinema rosaneae CENA516]|uniref:tetratricopeptide repeat protein n=1 Tax=Pantanalinema rosaneae TaxID=1620701 RepID=UPI003D6EECC9